MSDIKQPIKFTAYNFRLRPAIVYRTAEIHGVVEITHDRYPHKQILIVSKNREVDTDD